MIHLWKNRSILLVYYKNSPIICALDTNNLKQVYKWVDDIDRTGCMAKVGLELFSSSLSQNAILAMACSAVDVFLDLKFYDIPNTVYKSIQNFTRWSNIKMLTVHGSGDIDMIRSAVIAAEHIDVIAVTLLTSTETSDATDIVSRITEKSLDAGAAGVVCSAKEVKHLRQTFGNDFKIIVPGVRPVWYNTESDGFDHLVMVPGVRPVWVKNKDDQTRTGTPKDIMDDGADYLVIGRPITTATNPKEAIQRIMEEIQE